MKNDKTLRVTRYTIQERGFTLIEFLVVLGILIFIVPSVFGLIYSLLRQQSRIVALQEVKRQGDLAFNHMKVSIRNSAVTTYTDSAGAIAICTTAADPLIGATSIYFLNAIGSGSYFGYRLSGTDLLYDQTSSPPAQLTNSTVRVSNVVLGCTRTTAAVPPLVNVSFTVTEPTNNASLNYKTLIKIGAH